VHALRRRREGDPVNLALWCASLVYLFVTEPPLYFPEWFGLDRLYGFVFAHNRFTVQFMADRLPLYIVAFYPVLSQLAYEVVRSLGLFRRGALTGSVAVAFVCQVFYEVFDHLGPQLKWWAWNPGNEAVNHPALASVPLNSMLLFASVSMAAMTYLVVRLTGGPPRRGWPLVPRTLPAGLLIPPTMAIAGIPSSFAGENTTARAWILGVELALLWLAGAGIVVSHLRSGAPGEPLSAFARCYPAAYLGGMAVFWIGALPAYLAADDGVTADGTPIGSGLYALACFAAAGLLLFALFRKNAGAPAPG
jgi:hypothetical protein